MGGLNDLTYVPPPSIGHELGIMFGFIALMLISMAAYVVVWRIGNKRGQQKEQERIEQLRASGYLSKEKEGLEGVSGNERREHDQGKEIAM